MNIKKGFRWLFISGMFWLLATFIFPGNPINFFEASCFPRITLNCGGFPSYTFSFGNLMILVTYLFFAFLIGSYSKKNKTI